MKTDPSIYGWLHEQKPAGVMWRVVGTWNGRPYHRDFTDIKQAYLMAGLYGFNKPIRVTA